MNKNIMGICGLGEMVAQVEEGVCPFCLKPVNQSEFRDDLSKREHTISGLCQKCQDEFFEEPSLKIK